MIPVAPKRRARKKAWKSRRFRCRWDIITTITIIIAALLCVSVPAITTITITTIIITTITTEVMRCSGVSNAETPLRFYSRALPFAARSRCR
jgi:hypothetical protein